MKRTTFIALTLVLCVASIGSASWNHMTIDTLYPTWREFGYSSEVINDEIYFTHRDASGVRAPSAPFEGFGDQLMANPHIVKNDAGDWLIMGYGENTFKDTNTTSDPSDDIADAIYVFKRTAGNGQYVVPSTQALRFAPGTFPLGYLGAGAGVAKTTTTTVAGFKYFAIVQVGVPQNNLGWASWAVSSDGESWSFVNSTGTGLTTDARQSFHLLENTNPSVDYNAAGSEFEHPAMVYNPYDGYFYIPFGYSNACGTKTWWWRIKFNSANAYGLTPNGAGRFTLERLNQGATMDTDYYSVTDGVFNSQFGCLQSPRITDATTGLSVGAADPLDVQVLYNADGSFHSLLFIYVSEDHFASGPQAMYYIQGSLPTGATGNFVWDTSAFNNAHVPAPRVDFVPLVNQGYVQCSAGGGFYFGVVQSGNQTDGNPNLFGYVATYHPGSPMNDPSGDCAHQWSGFLPVHFNLTTASQ